MLKRFVYLQLVIIFLMTFLNFIGLHPTFFDVKYKIVVEIFYTISLLTLVGWILWWKIIVNYSTIIKEKYLLWSLLFVTVHLLCLTYLIAGDLGEGIREWHEVPVHYLILLSLIVIGFPFLFKIYWFDTIWLFLLVIFQQLQREVFQTMITFTIFILNSIHLIVVSIWISGLTFIIIFWKTNRNDIRSFSPIFFEYTLFLFHFDGYYRKYKWFNLFDVVTPLFFVLGTIISIKASNR